MEVSRPLEVSRIEELKILHNVRLLHRHDLNPITSHDNFRVQFQLAGELKGNITCYLCMDEHDLAAADKNSLFPLFVEAMNILIGRQITLDEELSSYRVSMSAPKLNMNPTAISTKAKSNVHKYELELESASFTVLAEYGIESLN